jgi:hypothetical protein
LVLGHTRLSNNTEGDRPTLNGEVLAAFRELLEKDYGGFIRHGLVQVTHGSVGDELAQQIIERVPRDVALAIWGLVTEPQPIEGALRELDVPLLFAAHQGCLVSTPEGFEDAVAAFPDARVISVSDSPDASPEFAEALHDFCLASVKRSG